MINRNREIEHLYDLLMARESIFLHAPSGMGKTSILNLLSAKLEGRRICFFINLRGLQNEKQLLHELLTAIHRSAEGRSNLQYQLKRLLEERPYPLNINAESLTAWFESLLVGLQNVSSDFLFIFEDLNQWEGKSDLAYLFGHFFRSRNSQPLFTADRPLTGFEQAVDVKLHPLNEKNLHFNDGMLQDKTTELLNYSGGNTALLLALIRQGAQEGKSVKQCMNQLLESYHPIYYNFRQRFTDLQWRLLQAVASEGSVAQPHSFDFLMTYRLGAASSVERAIKNLSDSGMILRNEDGWCIGDIGFRRWMEWLYFSKKEAVLA